MHILIRKQSTWHSLLLLLLSVVRLILWAKKVLQGSWWFVLLQSIRKQRLFFVHWTWKDWCCERHLFLWLSYLHSVSHVFPTLWTVFPAVGHASKSSISGTRCHKRHSDSETGSQNMWLKLKRVAVAKLLSVICEYLICSQFQVTFIFLLLCPAHTHVYLPVPTFADDVCLCMSFWIYIAIAKYFSGGLWGWIHEADIYFILFFWPLRSHAKVYISEWSSAQP